MISFVINVEFCVEWLIMFVISQNFCDLIEGVIIVNSDVAFGIVDFCPSTSIFFDSIMEGINDISIFFDLFHPIDQEVIFPFNGIGVPLGRIFADLIIVESKCFSVRKGVFVD